MTLRLEEKKAIVAELAEVANRSVSVIAAEYRGLTVAEMTELRTNARQSGVVLRVYRNTLARRAVEDTPFACLKEALVGPLVLMFSQDEPSAAARIVRDFAKEHKLLVVRALALGGQLMGADQLKAVASLPSREEGLAQLMSVMQAPVVKLARTLSETYAELVRVFAAVAETKR